MSHDRFFARFLRFIGIVLMGLTGGFTLLGGAGTACAAFSPTNPEWVDSMGALAPFQWLYILFVLFGIALGARGIWATVKLVRGTPDAYSTSIQALAAGLVIGGFHIYMSRMLRGKSMPVDAVVYTTALTLAIFLLFRIPGIWQGVNFERGNANDNKSAGGAAAILLGALTLAIQFVMGPTHTWGGVNYAGAFQGGMSAIGVLLAALGCALLARGNRPAGRVRRLEVRARSA
jgi:hypothetical protein